MSFRVYRLLEAFVSIRVYRLIRVVSIRVYRLLGVVRVFSCLNVATSFRVVSCLNVVSMFHDPVRSIRVKMFVSIRAQGPAAIPENGKK